MVEKHTSRCIMSTIVVFGGRVYGSTQEACAGTV